MDSKHKIIIVVICLEMLCIFGCVESAGTKENWFLLGAEEFTALIPISRPGQSSRVYSDSRPARGGSGANQNLSSGSDSGSCSLNLTQKAAIPEVMHYGLLGSPPKTKKQKALEKMERELTESIQEKNKINIQRKKMGKSIITLIIKNGIPFFALNDQLRDKYHHALDLDSSITGILVDDELARLADPSLY